MFLKFLLMIFIKQEKKELNYYLRKIHPLLMTRGVPGTHDIVYMSKFFKKVKSNNLNFINFQNLTKLLMID